MWLWYVRLFGFELEMGYFARSSTVNLSVEHRWWSLGFCFGFSYRYICLCMYVVKFVNVIIFEI